MTTNVFLSIFQTQSENQNHVSDGLASSDSDDEIILELKRKARAKNKMVKMNYAFDIIFSIDVEIVSICRINLTYEIARNWETTPNLPSKMELL